MTVGFWILSIEKLHVVNMVTTEKSYELSFCMTLHLLYDVELGFFFVTITYIAKRTYQSNATGSRGDTVLIPLVV